MESKKCVAPDGSVHIIVIEDQGKVCTACLKKEGKVVYHSWPETEEPLTCPACHRKAAAFVKANIENAKFMRRERARLRRDILKADLDMGYTFTIAIKKGCENLLQDACGDLCLIGENYCYPAACPKLFGEKDGDKTSNRNA